MSKLSTRAAWVLVIAAAALGISSLVLLFITPGIGGILLAVGFLLYAIAFTLYKK